MFWGCLFLLLLSGEARRKKVELHLLQRGGHGQDMAQASVREARLSSSSCSLPSVALESIKESVASNLGGALRELDPFEFPAEYGTYEYQGDLKCPLRSSKNRATARMSDFSDKATVKDVTCLGSTCITRHRWTGVCTVNRYKLQVLVGFDAKVHAIQKSDLEYCGEAGNGTADVSFVAVGNELTAVADVEYTIGGSPRLLSHEITEAKLGQAKDVECELTVSGAVKLDGLVADEVCEPLLQQALGDKGLTGAIEDAIVAGRPPAVPPVTVPEVTIPQPSPRPGPGPAPEPQSPDEATMPTPTSRPPPTPSTPPPTEKPKAQTEPDPVPSRATGTKLLMGLGVAISALAIGAFF